MEVSFEKLGVPGFYRHNHTLKVDISLI